MPNLADYLGSFKDDFGRGLDVLRGTYNTQGVGAAAGQLYGAADQNLRTGFGQLGVDLDPNHIAPALQNVGLHPELSHWAAGIADTGTDFLNPLNQVGGALAGGAIGDVAGKLAKPGVVNAAQNFARDTGAGIPLGEAPAAAGVNRIGRNLDDIRAWRGFAGVHSPQVPTPVPLAGYPAAPASWAAGKGVGEAGGRLDRYVGWDKLDYALNRDVMAKADSSLQELASRLRASAGMPEALTHVPPGSSYLGNGAEGIVFQTPGAAPQVRKIGVGNLMEGRVDIPPAAGPDLPRVTLPRLAPDAVYDNLRVESSPLARVGNRSLAADRDATRQLMDAARAQNYDWVDSGARNMGWVNGQPYIIDRGLMVPLNNDSMLTPTPAGGGTRAFP